MSISSEDREAYIAQEMGACDKEKSKETCSQCTAFKNCEIADRSGYHTKMVWKVFVSVFGEDCDAHGWHTNGMEYATKEEADQAGQKLAWNWLAVKDWESRQVESQKQ